VATIVAVVAGVVGFFAVLRGSAFAAHAIPQTGFAGAAGANLLGVSTVWGLGVFAVASALGIGWLGRRGRHDVATALALVVMLGLGALFLSMSVEYESEIYSLLFGEILGVSGAEVVPSAVLGALSLAVVACMYRPLMLASVVPEAGQAQGVRPHRVELGFLVVLALTTTLSVPVVGTLLMFSQMIGPAGAAQSVARRPGSALALSVAFALLVVWIGIAAGYLTNVPPGCYVGGGGAVCYLAGRVGALWSRARSARGRVPTPAVAG
jgi:zinc/manganese transport system permease protein